VATILAVIVSLSVAVRAQSVQGACQGSINPDGTLNKGDCGGSSLPAAPAAPSGPSYNPVQQAQLQGAEAVGAAAGQGIVNLLIGKPSNGGSDAQAQQQEDLQQQQIFEQKRRREAEARRLQQEADQAQLQKDRGELLGNLKDGSSDGSDENLFHERVAWDEHLAAGVKHQRDLTREDPTNKKNEQWCNLHRPLLHAPDSEKERWDDRCSADAQDSGDDAASVGGMPLK
jgi:hypothetical protein